MHASSSVLPSGQTLIARGGKSGGHVTPDQEAVRIPDEYWQLLEVARAEVQRARTIVEGAVSVRDRARTAAEAALRSAPETFREGSFALGRYSYAGRPLQQQSVTLGVLGELAQDRSGNLYEGEFLYVGEDVLFQGFGQYTSARPSDQIGYREYIGSFEGNFGTGHGRITYHDGGSYTGQTSRERAHGFGAYTDQLGTTIYAKFVDGKPEGKAVQIDAEGKRTAGEILPSGKFRPVGE